MEELGKADDDFLIHKINCYEILGADKIKELATAFWDRVWNDKEEDHAFFRKQYEGKDKQQGITEQYEFLVQVLGGPNIYTEKRKHDKYHGRPALHDRFEEGHGRGKIEV